MTHSKNYVWLFTSILLALCSSGGTAQAQGSITKTNELKLSKDPLYDLSVDQKSGNVTLTYLAKDRRNYAEFEQFTINSKLEISDEQEVRVDKEKPEVKWFRRKENGTRQSTSFLSVGNNLVGQMVIEKGYYETTTENHVAFSYSDGDPTHASSWDFMPTGIHPYTTSSTRYVEEEKEKFKGPEGRKLTLEAYNLLASKDQLRKSAFDGSLEGNAGDLMVMASIRSKGLKKGEDLTPDTHFMTILMDKSSMEIKKEQEFSFEYAYHPLVAERFSNGDMGVLFIPKTRGAINGPQLKSKEIPLNDNLHDCRFIRFAPDGSIKERLEMEIPIEAPSLSLQELEDGYMISGISGEIKQIYTGPGKPANFMKAGNNINAPSAHSPYRVDEPKHFVIARFDKEGKKEFAHKIPVTELIENAVSIKGHGADIPKSRKADKFYREELDISQVRKIDGHYFIAVTSFKEEVHQLIQLNEQGEFEVSYFGDMEEFDKEKKVSMPRMELLPARSGSGIHWLIYEHETGSDGYEGSWVKICKVFPDKKETSELEIPGDGKYYLNDHHPFIGLKDGKELLIFMNDGKKALFATFPL